MKRTCFCLLTLFALAVTVRPVGAQVQLSITQSRTNVSLSWIAPTNMTFMLEETAGLVPTIWTPSSSGPQNPVTVDVSGSGKYFRLRQAPTNMIWIPRGIFRMGSPTNEVDRGGDEGPGMVVLLNRGYWMGKYEVTQGEYLDVVGNNPSWFNGVRPEVDYGTDLTRPVDSVPWYRAVNYCALLTTRERWEGRIPASYEYRLPTEAEWEYACRARTATRFSHGDDPSYARLTDYGWYQDNTGVLGESDYGTKTVGQKLPNPWGLYDMHGNVFEWCQDSYGTYPGGFVIDPIGDNLSPHRVARGGNWSSSGKGCRSAARASGDPTEDPGGFGFRVVLAPVQP